MVVCETKNPDKLQEVAEGIWGEEHDYNLEETLHEIAYFRGEAFYSILECTGDSPNPGCLRGNYSHYAGLVRGTCNETLAACQWNDLKFKCCDYFMPLKTELGLCYALNSMQSE